MKWVLRFLFLYFISFIIFLLLYTRGFRYYEELPYWFNLIGVGGVFLWFYFYYHLFRTKFKSIWMKVLWFFILLYGTPFLIGQLLYFVFVYEFRLGINKNIVVNNIKEDQMNNTLNISDKFYCMFHFYLGSFIKLFHGIWIHLRSIFIK